MYRSRALQHFRQDTKVMHTTSADQVSRIILTPITQWHCKQGATFVTSALRFLHLTPSISSSVRYTFNRMLFWYCHSVMEIWHQCVFCAKGVSRHFPLMFWIWCSVSNRWIRRFIRGQNTAKQFWGRILQLKDHSGYNVVFRDDQEVNCRDMVSQSNLPGISTCMYDWPLQHFAVWHCSVLLQKLGWV